VVTCFRRDDIKDAVARHYRAVTQLAPALCVPHLMAMSNDEIYSRGTARSRNAGGATARGAEAFGPIIDQDGREIPRESLGSQFSGFRFDFGNSSANPFANLTREQRLARLDALAKLLDIAFILPGTNIRYGIDGIINLIPVVGDIITTAISLWLVREARALGAPWYLTARMLGNVAVQGVAGIVPVAGDAFDVMFRANVRNVRLLKRWMDKQPR
jgi:Domain of unknown function (DUF4112)